MKNDKFVRVSEESFKDINRVLKWYNLDHKDEKNQKQIVEYVLKRFKQHMNLDYVDREDEVDQSYVDSVRDFSSSRKTTRLDSNLNSKSRRKIRQIRDFLQNEPINNNRKVSMDDAIITAIDKYIELYPQIISLNDQYVELQIINRKGRKKK
jgi:hypothetical protein